MPIYTARTSGYVSNYVDIAGPDSGILSAVGNTIANTPGVFGPPLVTAVLAATGRSWVALFSTTAVLYAAQAALYVRYSSVSPVPLR